MPLHIIHQPLIGQRRLENPQPYRWKVTNNAAVPEPLAHGGESYTEERGAIRGAEATLEQLLRADQLDVLGIVAEWFDDMNDEIDESTFPPVPTMVIIGKDATAEAALELSEFFAAWRRRHGLDDIQAEPKTYDDTAPDGTPL